MVKPLLSDKLAHKEIINWHKMKKKILTNDKDIAEKYLPGGSENPVESAIIWSKNHSSTKLTENISNHPKETFSFQYISMNERLTKKLKTWILKNWSKPLINQLKSSNRTICHNFNDSLSSSTFPAALKYAGSCDAKF